MNGLSIDATVNLLNDMAHESKSQPQAEQMDMFGFDNSAINDMVARAKKVSQITREIKSNIASVQGAAKAPEKAAKLGVDVKDAAALSKKLAELKHDLARWDEWQKHDDLRAILRDPAKLDKALAEEKGEQLLFQVKPERKDPLAIPFADPGVRNFFTNLDAVRELEGKPATRSWEKVEEQAAATIAKNGLPAEKARLERDGAQTDEDMVIYREVMADHWKKLEKEGDPG